MAFLVDLDLVLVLLLHAEKKERKDCYYFVVVFVFVEKMEKKKEEAKEKKRKFELLDPMLRVRLVELIAPFRRDGCGFGSGCRNRAALEAFP